MNRFLRVLGFVVCALCLATTARAQTGGVRGSVKDPSGAVISGAKVTITVQGTGAQRSVTSGADGSFEFVSVAVAVYTVEVEAAGFKKFVQKDLAVDIGHVAVVNATMQIGQSSTTVTVEAAQVQVETTSTQLGAVVNERSVSELPLNARDVYQLLQIQPGVQSQVGIDLFYGSDKPGVVSVNGGRGRSNNYSVNGGEGNDMFANLPAIQPSPDTIDEFRVLTNTFDAEYGRNSGAVVNVVTKSGTNALHGDIYEFFRNKVLNAKGFLDSTKPDSKQNQYGITLGGPIKKDKTFIFGSYEGRRGLKGISSQHVQLPSSAETGATNPANCMALAITCADFSSGTPFGGASSVTIANILNNRAGCAAAIGLLGGTPGLTAALAGNPLNVGYWNTVPAPPAPPGSPIFPTNQIPTKCLDPVAVNLYQRFVPQQGNLANSTFQGVPNSINDEDQFTMRLDHHLTSTQTLTAYYFYEHDHNIDPFARFQAAGANIGTFPGLTDQATQQLNISHTWTIGSTAVNEARFTYFREGQGLFNHPLRTNNVNASCTGAAANFCFTGTSDTALVSGSGTPIAPSPGLGITPGLPDGRQGVPNIVLNGGFSIGNNFEGELPQVGNTFQGSETYSKVIGKHSLKFGVDMRYQKFDQTLYFDITGQFIFGNSGLGNSIAYSNSAGLGDSYPNYFLGLANSYSQGSAQQERVRSTSTYLFAQDSWKIKPNVTLNYGLRWELNTPLADIGKKVETFRPGQSTTIYPCTVAATTQAFLGLPSSDCNVDGVTPLGEVFPGDKGVPNGLTATYYNSFAPRVGLAWSPGWTEGWLKSLFGGPGKSSIRMGYGIFYNPVEQLVLEQFSAEPPFGVSPFLSNVLLQTPYVTQAGTLNANGAAGILNPMRGTSQDFARFEPILLFGEAQPNIRSQYSEQYNLTIQREFPGNVLFQIGYVGSQGHRLLATYDMNHGNQQACLDLANLSNTLPGSVVTFPVTAPTPTNLTCGPASEDIGYFVQPGTVLPAQGLHLPYGGPSGNPFFIPGGTMVGASGITLVGLRRYSTPLCQPLTAMSCPVDGVPVFSNIFVQDSIANSNYHSLQILLEKQFSHGFQLQGAYTFSKSIDNASSFENSLNPLNFRATRGLSLFDARNRFVLSYYWEFPVPKYQGFKGKLLDGWGSSGIATFQSGFPIRIIANSSDNELLGSFDFEAPGEPNLLTPFHTFDPRTHGGFAFDPAQFSNNVTAGTFGSSPRSLCCGPGINNFDITILKNTPIGEKVRSEFRAEFFNIFNHTQFIGVQGDITQNANAGAVFGTVLRTRDPRNIQFGLKFIF